MNQERLLKVILSPHVSEKTTIMSEKHNQYVFEVATIATKAEIKDAIEHLFNTKVKNVRVVNQPAKSKVFRGVQGKRKAWKKAYVTLQANQKLDISGVQ